MNREQLYARLDEFLDALVARAPDRLKWAAGARRSENNVMLPVGEGLWGTIIGLGDYRLRFADVQTNQVGFFGTALEEGEESGLTIRVMYDDAGAITEVEKVVVRQSDSGIKFVNQKWYTKPVLEQMATGQGSRAEMIALSNGYFDTLQLNDGTIRTKFHPDCQRVENGVQTTNNPEFANIVPVAAMACEDQFRMGNYRYDDRLRGRRYPLVDEERGLVLAFGFIDHSGKLKEYQLTDGRTVKSPIHRPHSFYLGELFRIEEGAIKQIEANFITVPYWMPSPWDA